MCFLVSNRKARPSTSFSTVLILRHQLLARLRRSHRYCDCTLRCCELNRNNKPSKTSRIHSSYPLFSSQVNNSSTVFVLKSMTLAYEPAQRYPLAAAVNLPRNMKTARDLLIKWTDFKYQSCQLSIGGRTVGIANANC